MISLVNDGTAIVLEIEILTVELMYLHQLAAFGTINLKPSYCSEYISYPVKIDCETMLRNTDTTIGRDMANDYKTFDQPKNYYTWLLQNLPRGLETIILTFKFSTTQLEEVEAALIATNYQRFIELSKGLKARFVTL